MGATAAGGVANEARAEGSGMLMMPTGRGIADWAFILDGRGPRAGCSKKTAYVARNRAPSRKGKEKVVEEDNEEDEDFEESATDSEEDNVNSADICNDDSDAESESDGGDDGEEGEVACGAKYGQVSGSKRQRGGHTGAAVVVDAEEPQWVPWEPPSVTAATASEETLPRKTPRKLPPKRSTYT